MPESHRYYYLENKMNAEAYKSWARIYGPNVYEFICKVIGTLRYEEQSYKSCNGILHMCKKNPKAFLKKFDTDWVRYNRDIIRKVEDYEKSHND